MNDDPGTRVSTVLDPDLLQRVRSVAQRESWDLEDAIRNLIICGLCSLEVKAIIDELEERTHEEKIDKLIACLMDANSAYAALRYQNFTLAHNNRTLEFNVAGLRGQNSNLKMVIEDLRTRLRTNAQQG